MKFGLNLYSIRNLIDTDEKFIETSKLLKEMGYDFIQYSGMEFNVIKAQKQLKEVGLPIYLTHVPYDRIVLDTQNLINEHIAVGCYNIGIGGLFDDMSTFKERIDKLEISAQKIANAGLKFFYHNHMHEFLKDENGEFYYDYIIKNAPHINFTLDTYWVQRGGVDIYELLEKISGRVDCVHFKDHRVIEYLNENNKTEYKNEECPLGNGTLNFEKILPAVKKAGAKYIFVEQDNAALKQDTLNQVEISIKYLKEKFKN